jgi:hypothetical protein
LRNLDGVRELRGGITTKVTDTTGFDIHCLGKFIRSDPCLIPHPFPVCPILAEETIKGASVIKHGQVLISIFRAWSIGNLRIASTRPAWTDPICHAIGGKPIIIPAQIPFF